MSLLHRSLLAAAFARIEPILAETLEAAAVAAGPGAPALALAVKAGDAMYQASQVQDAPAAADHVAAAIIAQSAPGPVGVATLTTTDAASKSVPVVNLAADKTTAALAAMDALGLQLSQLATQLAMLRSNIAP